MEAVEVKVRPVGNALGVIFPGRLVKQAGLKRGQKVFVSVFRRKKVDIDSLFGITKGASGFERDHTDRV
ncbi:MAG: hypothetical protein V1708_00165 [Candidatus Micrarchaeota archaeon]